MNLSIIQTFYAYQVLRWNCKSFFLIAFGHENRLLRAVEQQKKVLLVAHFAGFFYFCRKWN